MVSAAVDDLTGQAGRDDEGRSRAHRLVDLTGIDDGSGSDHDVPVLGHRLDGGGGGVGAEGHLGDGEPAVDETVGDGRGGGGVMDDDHRDDEIRQDFVECFVAHL